MAPPCTKPAAVVRRGPRDNWWRRQGAAGSLTGRFGPRPVARYGSRSSGEPAGAKPRTRCSGASTAGSGRRLLGPARREGGTGTGESAGRRPGDRTWSFASVLGERSLCLGNLRRLWHGYVRGCGHHRCWPPVGIGAGAVRVHRRAYPGWREPVLPHGRHGVSAGGRIEAAGPHRTWGHRDVQHNRWRPLVGGGSASPHSPTSGCTLRKWVGSAAARARVR